jgi:hypothetical protein
MSFGGRYLQQKWRFDKMQESKRKSKKKQEHNDENSSNSTDDEEDRSKKRQRRQHKDEYANIRRTCTDDQKFQRLRNKRRAVKRGTLLMQDVADELVGNKWKMWILLRYNSILQRDAFDALLQSFAGKSIEFKKRREQIHQQLSHQSSRSVVQQYIQKKKPRRPKK